MSESAETLRRKLGSAGELRSVVRTMKALAAANIGQYERAVEALEGYVRAVELALVASLRNAPIIREAASHRREAAMLGAVVFGSDLGLVGQYNETLAGFVARTLGARSGKTLLWCVGGRIIDRLAEAGLTLEGSFAVPGAVSTISGLIAQLLLVIEARREAGPIAELHLFHNRPKPGSTFEPVQQRLLPLDAEWERALGAVSWPTHHLPEVLGDPDATLAALIREHLFVSFYRTCAEALASENASRLAAMQRAEKNIDERVDALEGTFRQLRQNSIDEELFDLVAGYEALTKS